MILFQAMVLAITILLLTASWFLFQQAKTELTAKAAETPVLNEIRALHNSIKQLLTDIEESADRADLRLERRCEEARDLLQALEIKLASVGAFGNASQYETPPPGPKRRTSVKRIAADPEPEVQTETDIAQTDYVQSKPFEMSQAVVSTPQSLKSRAVFDLADAGEERSRIARATGMSEGEVETLLGLRIQRRDAK